MVVTADCQFPPLLSLTVTVFVLTWVTVKVSRFPGELGTAVILKPLGFSFSAVPAATVSMWCTTHGCAVSQSGQM